MNFIMKICIEINKQKFPITVQNEDNTIYQIKHSLCYFYHIPMKAISLYIDEKSLEDNKTLKEYNISENKTIQCIIHSLSNDGTILLHISKLEQRGLNSTFQFISTNNTTFELLDLKLQTLFGLEVKVFCHLYYGKDCEPQRYLSDYNVSDGKLLYLVIRMNRA